MLHNKILDIYNFILENKVTVGLIAGIILLLLIGGVVVTRKLTTKNSPLNIVDIDLPFDVNGPYAILEPRRDGNAINLTVKRIGAYESFSYQIAYTDQTGIERGAGDLNTWIDLTKTSGDYQQEILFGTCSRGNTSDPLHCVFDKGVENGTLTLRLRKGNTAYRVNIAWHLQKPDVALGILSSPDGHFIYKVSGKREDLAVVGYSVINDLSGAPKLPEGKDILGKVYALNVPSAKILSGGEVDMELSDNAPSGSEIVYYNGQKGSWDELKTSLSANKLVATASGAGIFTVLVPQKPK